MTRLALFPRIILCILSSILPLGAPASAPPAALAPAADKNPPDVYLITIDTLRADHVGCYGYKQVETPALDALAADVRRRLAAPAPR